MIMADIPFETPTYHSEELVVSENSHSSLPPMHFKSTATHIPLDTASLDSLGQLELPIGQEEIKKVLLQGSDLIIIQQDATSLVIDDFLGALEARLLTALRLSDGTLMDAIDFLDTFGDSDALNDIMYSLEAAAVEDGTTDEAELIGNDVSPDGGGETLDFTALRAQNIRPDDFGSVQNQTDATNQRLIVGDPAPVANTFFQQPLDESTLRVSVLLDADLENVLETHLLLHPDEADQKEDALLGREEIQTLNRDPVFSYQPANVSGFSDPIPVWPMRRLLQQRMRRAMKTPPLRSISMLLVFRMAIARLSPSAISRPEQPCLRGPSMRMVLSP
jgi:hypothetical protein